MTAEAVTYSLESVLKEIKDSIQSVDRKLDTFQDPSQCQLQTDCTTSRNLRQCDP